MRLFISRLSVWTALLWGVIAMLHAEVSITTEEPKDFHADAHVVGVLSFIGEDKILLLQRLDTHPQSGQWCTPGGKVQEGESPREAIIREFAEETGIIISDKCLKDVGEYYVVYPNGKFFYTMFQVYMGKEPQVIIQPAEHQAFVICTIEEALQLPLTPGLEALILQVLETK